MNALFLSMVLFGGTVVLPPVQVGPLVSEYFELLPSGEFLFNDLASIHIFGSDGEQVDTFIPRDVQCDAVPGLCEDKSELENSLISVHAYLPSLELFVVGIDKGSDVDPFRILFFNSSGELEAIGSDPEQENPFNADFRQIFEVDGRIFVNVYHQDDPALIREVELTNSGQIISFRRIDGRSLPRVKAKADSSLSEKAYSRVFLVDTEERKDYLVFDALSGVFRAFDKSSLKHDRYTDLYQLSSNNRVGIAYHLDWHEVKSQRVLERYIHSFTSNLGVFRLANRSDLIICTKNPNPEHHFYAKPEASFSDNVSPFVLRLELFAPDGQKTGNQSHEIPGGLLIGGNEQNVKVLSPTGLPNQYDIITFDLFDF